MNSNTTSKSLLSSPLSEYLTINPFKLSFLDSFLPNYNPTMWDTLVKKMMSYYDKILIVKGDKKYLPKGTKLYHGDIQYPFIPGSKSTGNKENMTFFGLDIDIAIWYILELVEVEKFKKDNNFSRFGFLYIFVLQEDLELSKIIDIIRDNPKEIRQCRHKNNVCLHPQVAYRGRVETAPQVYKLCSEVTLFYQNYSDILLLDKIYIVDPLLLELNKNTKEWKPRNAIIKKYNSTTIEEDIYTETIDAETYKRYYLGALRRKKTKKRKKTKRRNKTKKKKKTK